MMNNDLFKTLTEKRTTYKDMVDFCCDNMILNNDIISRYNERFDDLEVYCGSDYDEENDSFTEFFQYYIIDNADYFAEYTNEVVYYLPEFDMYVLAVSHWGTPWNGVSANWKETEA